MGVDRQKLRTNDRQPDRGPFDFVDSLFLTVFLGSGLALGLEELARSSWRTSWSFPFIIGDWDELLAFVLVFISGITSVLIILQRKTEREPVQFREFAFNVAIMTVYLAEFAFVAKPGLVLALATANFGLFAGWDYSKVRQTSPYSALTIYLRDGRCQATVVVLAAYLAITLSFQAETTTQVQVGLLFTAIATVVFYRFLKGILERHPFRSWFHFRPKLLVIGNITIDHVCQVDKPPAAGATTTITSHETFGGGRGANIAVIASRLGLAVDLASVVGRDLPRSYLNSFKTARVGVGRLRISEGGPTAGFYEFRSSASDPVMFLSPVTGAPGLEIGKEALEYGGVFITPFDSDRHIRDLQSVLMDHPMVFLSLGEEITGMDGNVVESALAFATFLLVNEAELRLVLDKLKLDAPSRFFEKFPRMKAAIVTAGSRGASIMSENGVVTIPAPKSSSRTDLGAGDSLAAGFIFDLLRGGTVDEGVRLGEVVASLAIENRSVQEFIPEWPLIKERFQQTYGAPLRDIADG